ncbi:hypothetical protein IMZ08_13770 [Bacillus luteolus]|uniref:Uncharacterized protein n=1 Tax=Litchfieldia luteola TaxID=682179 RepID=A0ABR9QKV2_9BACI|nr:hypothetical protein [Cytobacillus luteolus]MBE4909131.1 hypothetical protein [Cytobacillus luteolus]MBP1940418.1 energy-coupling factor transporter transmembrane protein EcfT [Cytobacillus luteolus]
MLHKIDKTYWVVLLIIGVVIGFLSGLAGPDLVHHTYFKHDDTFMVITPFAANILMFIAAGFFILFCIGMIFEKKVWNYVGILFLLLSIAMGYISLAGNYTLVSLDEITIVKSLQKEEYGWNEIAEATYLDEYQYDGRELHLIFNDGNEKTIEIDSPTIVKLIEQRLAQNGIDIN